MVEEEDDGAGVLDLSLRRQHEAALGAGTGEEGATLETAPAVDAGGDRSAHGETDHHAAERAPPPSPGKRQMEDSRREPLMASSPAKRKQPPSPPHDEPSPSPPQPWKNDTCEAGASPLDEEAVPDASDAVLSGADDDESTTEAQPTAGVGEPSAMDEGVCGDAAEESNAARERGSPPRVVAMSEGVAIVADADFVEDDWDEEEE